MFRDDEVKYVVASVVLAWIIAILVGYYEIFINRADSVLATVVSVIIGAAGATGFTLLLVGTWEVFSMLARRINERRLAEAREEGREEERKRLEEERRRLREWYANLPQEFRDQLPPPV
jgi:type VI protein secretion system component VasK